MHDPNSEGNVPHRPNGLNHLLLSTIVRVLKYRAESLSQFRYKEKSSTVLYGTAKILPVTNF